jgi:hypothetical protein
VEVLTIKARSVESAGALYSALAQFRPELEDDEQGGLYVSVELGSDRRIVEVLDAIQLFRANRAAAAATSALTLELDSRGSGDGGYGPGRNRD